MHGGSNAVTVEAWVRYTQVQGDSQTYGRLVTVAAGNDSSRDLALGNLGGSQYWFSMAGGDDALASNANQTLVHTVLVRPAGGSNTVYGYVNGMQVAQKDNTLEPKSMQAFPLSVGDSPAGNRAVKAEIHLLAFYGRALSEAEIAQNYEAGPDPGL